jgi:upstream activation factor subunit UAF30
VNKISSKEKMDVRLDRDRVFDRRLKVRREPFFRRNHRIHSKSGTPKMAGFKTIKRKRHHKANPGWTNILKQHLVSTDLQAVIGRSMCSRGQIVSLIWKYIRDHRLQKQGNGRIFVPDQTLARVVGNEGQELHGFKIMASINAHIIKEN